MPSQVGYLQVSSASLLDRSKSMKSELLLLIEPACTNNEGVDYCAPDEFVLRACIELVGGASWDGRWAIAVCAGCTETGAMSAVALVGRAAPLLLEQEDVCGIGPRIALNDFFPLLGLCDHPLRFLLEKKCAAHHMPTTHVWMAASARCGQDGSMFLALAKLPVSYTHLTLPTILRV